MLAIPVTAQRNFRPDKKLERKLRALVEGFQGDIGLFAWNLKSGKGAALQADTLFPTASTIKVPILCGLFSKIDSGLLHYHQKLMYRDSLAYRGSGLMQYFRDSTPVDLSVPVTLMITRTDNTAALWCQALAGGGQTINHWLEAQGFQATRVNSRTPGRHSDWEHYGWGQTTPREMARLLVAIYQKKVLSPAACERMYRNLTHIYWDGNALSQIPPFVQTASKSGAVDAARSEVVLVNAPHGDYVFAVYTKNNQDQRWSADNEASTLIREISALLWHFYEPHSRWHPASGMTALLGDE